VVTRATVDFSPPEQSLPAPADVAVRAAVIFQPFAGNTSHVLGAILRGSAGNGARRHGEDGKRS
jgi:hypothetical protein